MHTGPARQPASLTLFITDSHFYVSKICAICFVSLSCAFFLVGWVVRCVKNVKIRGKKMNVMHVKLCMMMMMVQLVDLSLFVSLSVALTILQGHSSVKQFWLISFMLLFDLVENLYDCYSYTDCIMNTSLFFYFRMYSKEIIDDLPDLTHTKNVTFIGCYAI